MCGNVRFSVGEQSALSSVVGGLSDDQCRHGGPRQHGRMGRTQGPTGRLQRRVRLVSAKVHEGCERRHDNYRLNVCSQLNEERIWRR